MDIFKVKLEDLPQNNIGVDKFVDWCKSAKPGERYTYHYGLHLHETLAVINTKNIAWEYAVDGKVYLFCMRDPERQYYWFFIAEKASRRIPRLNPDPKTDA